MREFNSKLKTQSFGWLCVLSFALIRSIAVISFFISVIITYSYAAEIKAKKMEILYEQGERITVFKEGLEIIDGPTTINSKEGIFFTEKNIFVLKDSVVIRGEEGILRSDSAVYYLKSKVTELFKDVELELDTLKILTSHLFWDGKKREAKSKEVFIQLKGRDVEITGKDATYDAEGKKGSLMKEPLILLKGEETTRVTANTMHYDGVKGRLFAYRDVKVAQKNRVLLCDTLIYYLEGDSGIAFGSPALFGDDEEIRGGEFRFWTRQGRLVRIAASGDVAAVYNRREEKVEIGGENFLFFIEGDKVSKIVITEIAYGRVIRRREKGDLTTDEHR